MADGTRSLQPWDAAFLRRRQQTDVNNYTTSIASAEVGSRNKPGRAGVSVIGPRIAASPVERYGFRARTRAAFLISPATYELNVLATSGRFSMLASVTVDGLSI